MELTHGGSLQQAAAEFGLEAGAWLDISTGISPWSWPVPPVPETVWQRLPEQQDGLLPAAADYYGCAVERLLPVPGSQYAIRHLPALWPLAPVALPLWGYREHHLAWQRAGHDCVSYRDGSHLQQLIAAGTVRHAVVINPNNPSTELLCPGLLQDLARQLARRDGRLLVDEAFVDTHPGHSLTQWPAPNLVVLRSLGKFFGLAGIRLGFVIADPAVLTALAATMNPWAVNHPARWLARQALRDRAWQEQQRLRLCASGRRWQRQLGALFPDLALANAALFVSAETDRRRAQALYRAAARRGVLLRLLDPVAERGMLRFGLPPAGQWQPLLRRLRDVAGDCKCKPTT